MTRLIAYLLGGYTRPIPPMGHMYFLTHRAATRYRTTFLGAIDPYARHMGPITAVPGRLIRRTPR